MKIIDLPFVFEADVVLKKKRKSERKELRSSVPCEVLETGKAPVALTCLNTEYRVVNGRLYEPCSRVPGGAEPLSPQWLLSAANPLNPRPLGMLPRAASEYPTLDELEATRIENSAFEAARVQALTRARDFCIIDGVPHFASPGPVHVIIPGDRRDVATLVTGKLHLLDTPPSFVWRADHLLDARRFLRTHWRRAEDLGIEPEIRDAGPLTFDETGFSAAFGVREALQSLAELRVRTFSDASLLALADLKEASSPESILAAAGVLAEETARKLPDLSRRMHAILAHSAAPSPALTFP